MLYSSAYSVSLQPAPFGVNASHVTVPDTQRNKDGRAVYGAVAVVPSCHAMWCDVAISDWIRFATGCKNESLSRIV